MRNFQISQTILLNSWVLSKCVKYIVVLSSLFCLLLLLLLFCCHHCSVYCYYCCCFFVIIVLFIVIIENFKNMILVFNKHLAHHCYYL